MKVNKEIKLPVRTDSMGLYIYDATGKMLTQVRGYGWIKNIVGEELAYEVQKELAVWLVDRINGIQEISDN